MSILILPGGQNPPEEITFADIQAGMGLAPGLTLLKDAPTSVWLQKGTVGMGIRPHWDTTPTGWGDNLTDYIGSGAPVAGEAGLFPGDATYGTIGGFWESFAPWYVVWPGVNNTNTNGVIEVVELNAYLLNNIDWTWEKLGNANGQQNVGANWGDTVTEVSNIGAAVAVTLQGRRQGYKFNDAGTMRYVHGYSNYSFSANAANIAALVWTARMRIVPPPNQTLDGVVEYYGIVAMDPYPRNLRLNLSVPTWDGYLTNTIPLAGAGYIPNCGVSKLHLLTSDGSFTRVTGGTVSGSTYPPVRSYTGIRYTLDAIFTAYPLFTQPVDPIIPISYVDFDFTRPVFVASDANAATLIASPTGTGVGTLADPCSFAYIYANLAAGEIGFLRGGNYAISSAVSINNSGDSSGRIILESYPGELAVLDGSSVAKGAGTGQITVNGDFWHFRNIDISSMPRNGLLVNGSNNFFEYITSHDNGLNGIQVYSSDAYPYGNRGSWNIFIDCTSHSNSGVGVGGEHGNGENSDGFSISSGRGNRFIRPRAWGNSDDGFDAWGSLDTKAEDLIIHNNGDAAGTGDGNGIKGGRSGYVGNFIAINALVYSNLGAAFTHNSGSGASIERITEWDNAVGFDLSALVTAERCVKSSATNFGTGSVVGTTNSWDEVGTPAFVSTDPNSTDFLKITTGTAFSDLGARRKLVEL